MRKVMLALLTASALTACSETVKAPAHAPKHPPANAPAEQKPATDLLAGMPDYPNRANIYAAAGANMLREDVRGDRELVYVPNTNTNSDRVPQPGRCSLGHTGNNR